MGANHSVIMLEGDHTQRLAEVVSCFGLELTSFRDRASGLAEIWERTNWPCKGRPRECVHKAVVMSGPWTAILDREMSMILNAAACEQCAAKFGTRIIGYFVEDISQSAGFFLYAPNKVRAINIQNDETIEDFGKPLPEEKGILHEQLLEDGVIRIARRFGFVDAVFANPRGHSMIVEVIDHNRKSALKQQQKPAQGTKPSPREDYGGASGIHVEASGFHSLRLDDAKHKKHAPPPPPANKPWWKFW